MRSLIFLLCLAVFVVDGFTRVEVLEEVLSRIEAGVSKIEKDQKNLRLVKSDIKDKLGNALFVQPSILSLDKEKKNIEDLVNLRKEMAKMYESLEILEIPAHEKYLMTKKIEVGNDLAMLFSQNNYQFTKIVKENILEAVNKVIDWNQKEAVDYRNHRLVTWNKYKLAAFSNAKQLDEIRDILAAVNSGKEAIKRPYEKLIEMLEKAAKELRLVNDEVIRLRQMHYKHATVKAMTPEEYKPTEASIKLLKENIRQLQQKDKQHQVDLEKLKNELKIKETNIEETNDALQKLIEKLASLQVHDNKQIQINRNDSKIRTNSHPPVLTPNNGNKLIKAAHLKYLSLKATGGWYNKLDHV